MTEPAATTGDANATIEPTQNTPEPAANPILSNAKLEVKEGRVLVDGKAYVSESDLIAAKRSLESKLEQQQKAHESAIDIVKLESSSAQQQIAALNAKIQENEQARESGATSNDDAAKVKQELEGRISALEPEASKALEYRRALMVLKYGVAEDTIKDKSMPQLDAFEEALKAVATARGGIGPYATGGGTGDAAPQTPMDRAAKILASTPMRGTRTADTK